MAFDVAARSQTASPSTVLVIGADEVERNRFAGLFERDGFHTLEADGPEMAGRLSGASSVDLVIFDERACGARAYAFCRASAVEGGAPVILLSENCDMVSRIVALEVGADEVLPAEVDGRLLLAQARAMLRRTCKGAATGVPVPVSPPGHWSLDPEARVATGPGGDQVVLARNQVRLMQIFLDNPGAVITLDRIAREDSAMRMEPAAFRTAMSRLRRRLAPLDPNEFIRVLHGSGYVHPAAAPR